MADTKKPSLQRLLALDKSFENLEQRIQEAARILSINLPENDEEEKPKSSEDSQHIINHGRHEFVLRWILEKLKAQPEARSTVSAWKLACHVLRSMSAASSARILGASEVISTILTTMEEHFPGTALDIEPLSTGAQVQPIQEETKLDTKKSKKRKRSEKHSEGQAGQGNLSDAKVRTFVNISGLLRVLLDRCHEVNMPSSAIHQAQAVLRMERSKAAKFVKHWLYALCNAVLTDVAASSRLHTYVNSHLSIMAHVWKLQPAVSMAEREDSVQLFAQQCLTPAMLLLSLVRSATQLDEETGKACRESTRCLERLIAEQVLLPGRAAFHDQVSSKSDTGTATTQAEASSLLTNALLSAVQTEFRNLQRHSSGSSTHRRVLISLGKGLAQLIEIALRCTNMSTPSRKRAEISWLDEVFSALVQPARLTPTFNLGSSALVEMLDVLARRDLSLGRDVLVLLLDNDSHLGDDDNEPEFSLIARIVSMDASIFTDPRTTFGDRMFDSLTKHAVVETEDKNAAFSQNREHSSSIAIALMKAFARARDLQNFLRRWYEGLAGSPAWKENDWYIWSDDALNNALGDVLESSLTAVQIAEQIQTYQQVILESDVFHKNTGTPEQYQILMDRNFASTVVLNAITRAISSDSLLDELANTLVGLKSCINNWFMTTKARDPDSLVTTHLWPLMSRLSGRYKPLEMLQSGVSTYSTASNQDFSIAWRAIERVIYPDYKPILAFNTDWDRQQRLRVGRSEMKGALEYIILRCDLDRKLSGSEEQIQKRVHDLIADVRRSDAIPIHVRKDGHDCEIHSVAVKETGAFAEAMARYPKVWELLPSAARREVYAILQAKSDLWPSLKALVATISETCSSETKSECFEALFEQSSPGGTGDQSLLAEVLLQIWPMAALNRQQREKTLDWITLTMLGDPVVGTPSSNILLSLAIKLSDMPNATSQLATDSDLMWKLATALQNENNETTMTLFAAVCQLTLKHIFDTKEQDRSKKYLHDFSALVERHVFNGTIKASSLYEVRLTSTFITFAETELSDANPEELPHRLPGFVERWAEALWSKVQAELELGKKGSSEPIVTFAGIPTSYWQRASSSEFVKKLSDFANATLVGLLGLSGKPSHISKSSMQRRLPIAQQVLLSKDAALGVRDLSEIAAGIFGQDIDAHDYYTLEDVYATALQKAPDSDVVSVVEVLLAEKSSNDDQLALASVALASVKRSVLETDDTSSRAKALLPRILALFRDCTDYRTHVRLAEAINTILQQKPFLVDQSSVERVLGVVHKLSSPTSPQLGTGKGSITYSSLCTMTRNLLQFHRASLGGRLHLVLPVIQQLLSCLFVPHRGSYKTFKHPSWLDAKDKPLGVKHAQRYSRLLTLLCNPPQSTISGYRHKSKTPDLVDDVRKARIHVGQYVQYLLHSYCEFQLNGRLGEGVREALNPGFYAVMDVMDMSAEGGMSVKALSASMSNQQRALLRREWDGWKKFGSWKGN